MKAWAWSRGDLCDHFGDLAIVVAGPNRLHIVELEVFASGVRAKALTIHLRPRKAQLERERRRLLAVAKRSKNYAAHLDIELKRRSARAR